MQTGILSQDNGAISAEDWAQTSAAMLLMAIKVDPASPRRTQIEMAKNRVQAPLAAIFFKHHEAVQRFEREKLAAGDHTRLLLDLDIAEHTDVDQCVGDVLAIVEPLLSNPQLFRAGEVTSDHDHIIAHISEVVRQRSEMDLRTTLWIERSWHADRHPDHEHSKAFRAASAAPDAA
jgi:hypothetical protein